jgi:hypothetical protein
MSESLFLLRSRHAGRATVKRSNAARRPPARVGVAAVACIGVIAAQAARPGSPPDAGRTAPAQAGAVSPRGEKHRLKTLLRPGMDATDYMRELQSRGYTITARNDKSTEAIEYEIVKGRDSYEVKLRRDRTTGKVVAVDVTANLWRADGTEAALARPRR